MAPGQKLSGGELANCNVTTRGDKSSADAVKTLVVQAGAPRPPPVPPVRGVLPQGTGSLPVGSEVAGPLLRGGNRLPGLQCSESCPPQSTLNKCERSKQAIWPL
jgi:hypothetical protein